MVLIPAMPSPLDIARMWETLPAVSGKSHGVLLTAVNLGTTLLEDTKNVCIENGAPLLPVVAQRQEIRRSYGYCPQALHGYDDVLHAVCKEIDL